MRSVEIGLVSDWLIHLGVLAAGSFKLFIGHAHRTRPQSAISLHGRARMILSANRDSNPDRLAWRGDVFARRPEHRMRFYRIVPYGNEPILPPDELSGEVPISAYRFCEPFLAANRAGWLLCPPTSFELLWTGREFLVKFDTIEDWIKVDKLFLPEFADYWRDKAPAAALEMIPPFLEAFPSAG